MDFDVITPHGAARIMTTHRAGDDETPLQLISVQQLEYFKRVETEYRRLLERLAEEVAAAPILPSAPAAAPAPAPPHPPAPR